MLVFSPTTLYVCSSFDRNLAPAPSIIGHKVLKSSVMCFALIGELKIMEQGNINKQGRIFQFGKALGENFRSLVIQSLIENGADSETRIIPRGVMSKISANFKVSKNTVKNVWMTY